jgi:hypothetical protein
LIKIHFSKAVSCLYSVLSLSNSRRLLKWNLTDRGLRANQSKAAISLW